MTQTKQNLSIGLLFKEIKFDYWLLMVFVFFMKAGQFMLLPYFALYLSQNTQATPTIIGVVVGSGLIFYGMFGLISGWLIDHFNTKKIIVISLAIAGLDFVFFNTINAIWYYFLISCIAGISRSLFDTATRSYKVKQMTVEVRRLSFSIRFTVLNAAAALGPWIGVQFVKHNSMIIFQWVGVAYLILMVLAQLLLYRENLVAQGDKPQFRQIAMILWQDRLLLFLVIGSFMLWMAYAQIDTTLPLYLKQTLPNGITVFAWFIIINCIGCAVLQIPISRWMANFSDRAQIISGNLFFMIGFLIIAYMADSAWILVASGLIVIGENILAVFTDLLMYRIAPANKIGLYFGASIFTQLGVGVGPIIGGVIYQYFGSKMLFIGCVLCFIATWLSLQYVVKNR